MSAATGTVWSCGSIIRIGSCTSVSSARTSSTRPSMCKLFGRYSMDIKPMDLPDAVEAIKFRMEQSGLTVKDLEPVIGRKNRVYEILSRRRLLTLRMIEGLHIKFGIPAESLLKQRTQRDPNSAERHLKREAR